MKAVYTHEIGALVQNAKNILEDAQIKTLIKNEFASGGAGDLVPMETWPELCVVDERDYSKATELLKSLTEQSDQPDWICSHCNENNGVMFELCWNCSNEKPTT